MYRALEDEARARGYPTLPMTSGAGHDAMHMARIAPMGMLFIPCRDGRSHCPEEWAAPEDLARGAEVLAGALLRLDGMDQPVGAGRVNLSEGVRPSNAKEFVNVRARRPGSRSSRHHE